MSEPLAVALVLLGTLAWVALPLLPAVLELVRPTDVDPLVMVGRDNADISRFARHFREYAMANLTRLPSEALRGDYFGKLADGTHFVRVARLTHVLERGALPDGSHDRVVILEHPTELRGHERFRLEVWAKAAFHGGPAATYRAVLGETGVRLGARSTVLRWVHATGVLDVMPECRLFGRVSSEREIRLGDGVEFQRMGAPAVIVGQGTPPSALPAMSPAASYAVMDEPERSRRLGDHLRVETDWYLPPHTLVEGHLVVAGRLHVSPGVRIRGSVKAHGPLEVDQGAIIEGSVVSRDGIRLGAGCAVGGPVIAEGTIEIGSGTSVGTLVTPTTVTGRRVRLAPGVVVCGHIVTEEGGVTAA